MADPILCTWIVVLCARGEANPHTCRACIIWCHAYIMSLIKKPPPRAVFIFKYKNNASLDGHGRWDVDIQNIADRLRRFATFFDEMLGIKFDVIV
ncbi:hypothetical protein SAMN04488032_11599 [Pacificibacter marinus]|uniref:Uncharacterized protein n=1 Tax=Pacificibacter marinus TaxID=658057 RepID=A0A1Y5THR9_9RHOB|nr:hypothetical protein SAMN04488032_11599 [Pacificibacter marinus]SLN64429.1 hypothetical protein PAM7971_03364 [Pacificibacter marinus]